MRRGTDRQTHRRPWPIHISPRLCLTPNVTNAAVSETIHSPFCITDSNGTPLAKQSEKINVEIRKVAKNVFTLLCFDGYV